MLSGSVKEVAELNGLVNEEVSEKSKEDNVAEWSKALALGASPKGRGFEPHRYQTFTF